MSESANDWPWPPELDAVIAAPDSHRVLLEDSRVRVLAVTVPPGVTEPRHTHRWPSVMVLTGDATTRYHEDGGRFTDSAPDGRPVPRAFQLPPEGPHWVENLDSGPFIAIRVEFK
jgi:predicted metal-dependent enzyme (double-stranded beta helix superfamily)